MFWGPESFQGKKYFFKTSKVLYPGRLKTVGSLSREYVRQYPSNKLHGYPAPLKLTAQK